MFSIEKHSLKNNSVEGYEANLQLESNQEAILICASCYSCKSNTYTEASFCKLDDPAFVQRFVFWCLHQAKKRYVHMVRKLSGIFDQLEMVMDNARACDDRVKLCALEAVQTKLYKYCRLMPVFGYNSGKVSKSMFEK
jgi:hypothetical protein